VTGYYLSLDIGEVRTGIAKSDPLDILATPLKTIPAGTLLAELKNLITPEVKGLVVGMPYNLKGQTEQKAKSILAIIETIRDAFPDLLIIPFDERYSSKIAQQQILASGRGKKARQEKGLVDRQAAAIILQDYLDSISNRPTHFY